MGNELSLKFVRAHKANITTSLNGAVLYWMKLVYEFWGFCVWGGSDLRAPGLGSFASLGGTLAPAYLQMATGFESGSAVLIASGSDGSTVYNTQVFSAPSVNWTSGSMLGRHLVTWISGSSSSDDSIYPIIQILGSSSILVDTNSGATPMSGSNNQPRFTGRSNINFRVIDLTNTQALTGNTNDYMILQFNGNAVNVGQVNSQARIRLKAGNNTITQGNISLSASGSWNGTSFTDIGPESFPDVSASGGPSGFSTGDWTNGGTATGISYFTLIGDQASIISHAAGSLTGLIVTTPPQGASWFHIEIPTRLFPASKDPNPICFANVGHNGVTAINFTEGQHWSAGWLLHNPFDNVQPRRYHALVRNLTGHVNFTGSPIFTNSGHPVGGLLREGRFQQVFFNSTLPVIKYVIQEVLLAHRVTSSSYTMGRVKLRRTALAPGAFPVTTKLASGSWVSVNQGVLWPWDNTNLPYSLFPGGV